MVGIIYPIFAPEILVQVVKDCTAMLKPLFVRLVSRCQSMDESSDSGGFGFLEFLVLQIKVVYDLADLYESFVLYGKTLDEDVEAAEITFVGELTFKHVEPQFTDLWPVPSLRNEPERSIRINEATNRPCDPRRPLSRSPMYVLGAG
jgi:hypothetical protein